eukprot:1161939-Pelagomonas_calceolata.AAC.9
MSSFAPHPMRAQPARAWVTTKHGPANSLLDPPPQVGSRCGQKLTPLLLFERVKGPADSGS